MNLEKIKNRIECCALINKEGISWNVTRTCSGTVLLKNLKDLIESGRCADFKIFKKDTQAVLLSDEKSVQYAMELLKAGVSAVRVEELLKEVPLGTLMTVYTAEEAVEVLQDARIKSGHMGIYLKYYLHDRLDDEEILHLFSGMTWFRGNRKKLTDDWIGEIGERRKLLLDPVIGEGCLGKITDTDQCMRILAGNENLQRLLDTLYCAYGYHMRPDDSNFDEMAGEAGYLLQLWNWAVSFFSHDEIRCLIPLWLENHALVHDLEYMKSKAQAGELVDKKAFMAGRASYVAFLYNESFPIKLDSVHEELVIYAISRKKKAFLRLLKEHIDLYEEIPVYSILFCRSFYDRCINLNTLNVKNLEACKQMAKTGEENLELISGKGYTFEEISLIYRLPGIYIRLYGKLSVLRTDDRLRVMREIARRKCLNSNTDIEKVASMLICKPLSEWMRQDFGHIRNLTGKNAIGLLGMYKELAHLIPDIADNVEARYVMQHMDHCMGSQSMKEIREKAVDYDEAWKYLAKEFVFSDAFIDENRERVESFIFNNGAHIFRTYYNRNKEKAEDLRRLVCAELMGRFRELKYFKDDLSREINYPITEKQKERWMENTNRREGQFFLWEEDGLIPVMKMGVMPYETCLSYESGSYSQCLLACHDSNKKVLYMSFDGKVVLRAAIRLTKGTYDEKSISDSDKRRLHFADLEACDKGTEEDETDVRKEYLTLFLERAYMAGIPDNMKNKVFRMMLHMMLKKAESMNALFAASMTYWSSLSDVLIPVNYSMYISKSKAGEQYLDSMGGSKCVKAEGSYNRNRYLVERNKIRTIEEDAV